MKYFVETAINVYECDVASVESIYREIPKKDIIRIEPAKGHHICQYCGSITDGEYEDLLCRECRDTFGHSLFSEL